MNISKLKDNFEKNPKYKLGFKVNKYIGIDAKIGFVEEVKKDTIDILDNGMFEINYMLVDMKINQFLLRESAGIKIESDSSYSSIEQYDFLAEKGVIDYVLNQLKSVHEDIKKIVDKTLEQEIRNRNCIEGILASGINKLIEKVPNEDKLMDIVKNIKNFDASKLNKIKDLFNFATNKK